MGREDIFRIPWPKIWEKSVPNIYNPIEVMHLQFTRYKLKMKQETTNFGLQRTGLLSMLDVECSIRGTAESYIAKVKVQHKQNPRLFEPKTLEPRTFGIQHFAGRVVYDASDFLGKQIPSSFYLTKFKQSTQQM
jgi:hypothetical protein